MAGFVENVNKVATELTAGFVTKINTVVADTANISTVATNIASVNTVASNIVDVNAVVATIIPNMAEILQADSNAAVATAMANICTSTYDQFDDRYLGAKATAPLVDNDGTALVYGALYFDTTQSFMKVWSNAGWINAGSSVNGTTERYVYTATAGQTVFAATYEAGYVDVFLNGSKLQNGVDFTAVTATSVTLISPASVGDVVDIICYAVFELSTAPTKDVVAYTVSTVDDLTSVPSSYTTAIVKDLDRGGTFIWSSTGTANGGTIFAGATGYWTRQYSGAVNVKWFGAKGDGVTDDTSTIQNALNNANVVYAPEGTYILGAVNFYLNSVLYGVCGLNLKSGTALFGSGDKTILKVKDNCYGTGALYGAIRSDFKTDIVLRDFKIDGNISNQTASTQCSNIYLHIGNNVSISNIFSINANGQSIQVVGNSVSPSTLVSIHNNIVDTALSIGIQVSHCSDFSIKDNSVVGCVNNSIDIYNEDGDTVASGRGGLVTDNVTHGGLTSLFIETSREIVCDSNILRNPTEGCIHINRINGEPRQNTVTNNKMVGGVYSVLISGVGSNNVIDGNTMEEFTTSPFKFYGGASSGCLVKSNHFVFASATQYLCEINNTIASSISFTNNTVNSIFGGISYIKNIVGTCTVSSFTCENLKYSDAVVISNNLTTNGYIGIASGANITIPLPAAPIAGSIALYGESGGAWNSSAIFSFVSSGLSCVGALVSSNFIAPGQLFGGLTTSGANIIIATTATGSGGVVKYRIDYV